MFFYYNEYYYYYNDGYLVDLFLDFVTRILNPVVELTTKSDVDRFIDLTQKYAEKSPIAKPTYKMQKDTFPMLKVVNRAVAFVSKPQEFEEDLKKYTQAAVNMFMRNELRMGVCTNQEAVQYYKNKMGTQWFDDYSSNSFVLFTRHNGAPNPETTAKYLDIGTAQQPVYQWINSNSLSMFEELSGTVYRIINLLRKPFFIAFLADSNKGYDAKSDELYSILSKLAPNYPQFQFTYSKSDFYKSKKEGLGITWKEDPALTFAYGPSPGQAVALPQDKEINEPNVIEFIESCLNGSVIPKPTEKPNLPKRTFDEVCLTQGTDVLLLIYDSSMDMKKTNEIGPTFTKAARRFVEIGIKSVKLTQMDSKDFALPEGIGPRESLPQVVFFPAYHKEQPYATFSEVSTEAIMRRVQSEADIKFDLPENFHLTREDLYNIERQKRAADL